MDAKNTEAADQLDVLKAKLIELRDATDEVLTYIETLMAFDRVDEFNPRSGVMNQMADALRSANFVSLRTRMDLSAEGADSLTVTH